MKADKLLGWLPLRGWRDMLDTEGHLLPVVRDRLAAGETAVQRGLAAISRVNGPSPLSGRGRGLGG